MKGKKFAISIDKKKIVKYFQKEEDGNRWIAEMREKLKDPDLEGEIWVDIPNYSRYKASNYGRIKSTNYKNSGAHRLVQPSFLDGYGQSMFQNDDGKYTTKKFHYLVALAFYGVRPDNCEVNHINGNKTDNRIENLEYITHAANCQHSFDYGLQKPKRGELNGMAKLTWEQVENIREMKRKGGKFWGRRKLAKEYGISEKHMQKIANTNRTWTV